MADRGETPETKAPETKAPETKVSEAKAPETKVPETKVPETKVPETKARATDARPKGERNAGELHAAQRHAAELYASVAAGSVIGSVLRWLVGLALPWGTLFVNLTGSFAIGFFAGMTAPGGRWFVGPRMRQFFMTGICGGYTTFSMFSLETLRLLQQGKLIAAAGYIALSLVAWCGAVWAGDAIAMRLNRLKGA